MLVEELAVGEVGEDVAVHHQEVLVEAVEQAQGADRAERLLLAVVVDRDPVALAVAEEGLDQLGQVAGDDRQPLEAVRAELAHDHVEDRPVADRHQRLRQDRRVGPQAHPEAAGEYHCALHGAEPTHGAAFDRHAGCCAMIPA